MTTYTNSNFPEPLLMASKGCLLIRDYSLLWSANSLLIDEHPVKKGYDYARQHVASIQSNM